MNEIQKRTVTAVAIVGVIVFSVMLGRVTFFILCVAISLLGLLEFYRLMNVKKRVLGVAGILLSASLMMTIFLHADHQPDLSVIVIDLSLMSFIFVAVLFLKPNDPFREVASIFLGQIYVTLPLILLYGCAFVLDGDFSRNVILGYFFLLWANDTGAYIIGSSFGKHKLAAVISPKKTWEGSAGGAFFVAVLAYVNYYFFGELSFAAWIVLGIIVVVMGTAGDLIKSVLKRSRNVKDSGNILPGHGGILDRFDSLIGSIPFVYAYLAVLNFVRFQS